LDYSKARLKLDLQGFYTSWKAMAHNKIKQLSEIAALIHRNNLTGKGIGKYITQNQQGQFAILDNDLKADLSSYVESDTEDRLLTMTQQLQAILTDFAKLGICKRDAVSLINNNTLDIIPSELKKLANDIQR
jgi:hypothetical protein